MSHFHLHEEMHPTTAGRFARHSVLNMFPGIAASVGAAGPAAAGAGAGAAGGLGLQDAMSIAGFMGLGGGGGGGQQQMPVTPLPGGGVVGGSASPLTPFGVRGQQQQSPSTLGQMSLSGLLGAFNPTPQFAPTASAMMPSISAVQSQPLVQHIPLR